ncbi:MAG: universal stress protein [Chloroflexi bacterium]|nr:universal stress protein [Chloroflexota bacterium]
MKRILVPLDGSDLAERALPLAARLADLHGAEVLLLDAAANPTAWYAGTGAELCYSAAHGYVTGVAATVLERYGVTAIRRVSMLPPVEAILQHAAEPEVVAIVMATHARDGLPRLMMGSVAEQVVRNAPVSVYLLPVRVSAAFTHPRLRRILVPLDGSQIAHAVLAPIAELASIAQAEVRLVRVFGDEDGFGPETFDETLDETFAHRQARLDAAARAYFEPVREHLAHLGIGSTAAWSTGPAGDAILSAAERYEVQLIAMGTHGRAGLDRIHHGSVAEHVLRHANVPVMTFGREALKRLAAGVGPAVDQRRVRPSLGAL